MAMRLPIFERLRVDIAYSVNGAPIRLTQERWNHIVHNHDDLAGYDENCLRAIEAPDPIVAGTRGSLKAVKGYGRTRFLVVVYREASKEGGLVIPAYFAHRIDRRQRLWPR